MSHFTHHFAPLGDGATAEVRELATAPEHSRFQVRVTLPGVHPFVAASRRSLTEAMQFLETIAYPLFGPCRMPLAVDIRLDCQCDGDTALDAENRRICAHCGRPKGLEGGAHAIA